jgi:Xaa-Pro dipeptidase
VPEKQLIFPEAEYRARLAALRQEMERADVEVLLLFSPENVYYLTGHQTFGYQSYQCCAVALAADPLLVVRFLESFNVAHFSWVSDAVIWDDHEDPAAVTARALQARGWDRARVGSDDAALFFPPLVRARLDAALGGRLRAAPGLVERCRAVKSPAEIAYMRKAAVYTDLGMTAALAAVRAGATENEVAAAAFAALTRAGSEYVQIQPVVTSGWRAGIPHTTYQRRTLEPGDAVPVELTGTHHRYVAPLMRTAVVGPPPPKVAAMYDVCAEALAATMAAIRPDTTAGAVDAAARRVIEGAGYYENWRKRTGYSVGCSFPPDWGEGGVASLRHGDPTPLAAGMVFHLPIALRDYGVAGVALSETVLVTADGCEPLGSLPRALVQA